MEQEKLKEINSYLIKIQMQNEALKEWIYSTQLGHPLKEYFIKNGVKNIAIYGDGDIGLLLCKELINTSDINVCCFIDRQARENPFGIRNVQHYEASLGVDLVVVTPLADFNEIKQKLTKEGAKKVVSLADVIREA